MAADTLELLDHFGWNDNVHLVGISMGGMISLELTSAEPARFLSVTLTSTTSKRNIPTVSKKKVYFFAVLTHVYSGWPSRHFLKSCSFTETRRTN